MKSRYLRITWLVLLLAALLATAAVDATPPANIRLTNIPQLNNEEQVFICPTDSNVIIANWRDFRLGYRRIGVGRSVDGGLTWVDSLISAPMMLYGFDSQQSDPTMTVDAAGNFYMSALDWDAFGFSGGSSIAFYRSSDKGVSWTGPVPIVTPIPTSGIFEDKQFITADRTCGPYDGNVYCAWARFYNGPNRIMFIRSTDGCASFDDTVIVGPQQTTSACGATVYDAGQFAFPLVGADGAVHVFWLGNRFDSSSCSAYSSIKHVVSHDGGASFTYEDNILDVYGWTYANGGIDTYSEPIGDADLSGGPFNGNIYVAFGNIGPEDTLSNLDIDLIMSTDNAATWSNRLQVNDDAESQLIDSFHPWLVVNQEGVVIIIFYDQRLNPPSYQNFDVFAAYSFDGGQSFTSNERITTVSSSPFNLASVAENTPIPWVSGDEVTRTSGRLSPRGGLIGEYIGVTAYYDKVNAVWTDSRDGNSECYTANWYLAPMAPRLFAPEDGAYVGASGVFSWATSWKHNDDRYRLEFSTDPGFGTIDYSIIIDTVFDAPATSLTDGYYYWRVKTFSIATGDSSDYSVVRGVEIDLTPPDPPSLIFPQASDLILDSLPVFEWTEVTKSPVIYDLYLSTNNTFPAGPSTAIYTDIPSGQYALTNPLTDNVTMYWKVLAKDAAGNSTFSATRHFVYRNLKCGDMDATGDVNIADLTYFVDYLFAGGPAPDTYELMDMNGDGTVDIQDLTYMVDYLFAGGDPLIC